MHLAADASEYRDWFVKGLEQIRKWYSPSNESLRRRSAKERRLIDGLKNDTVFPNLL
jgi:hypothetical protein